MARLTLTVQTLTMGLAPTYSAIVAADDAQFAFDPDAFLHIRNTTGGAIVLTIPTNQNVDGDLDVPDRTISIPASPGAKFTKPFAKDTYKQSDNMVYLNAPTDGLEIAVLKVP
jgi:hypothetical protein